MIRSLAEQTVDELGGSGSVLARQRRDHVDLDHLLTRLRATSGAEQDEVLQRIHPRGSRRPPGNVLAALPLTLLDRSRDGLDAASRRAPAPLGVAAAGASRALAAVAGLVEHVGPVQRGEDRSTSLDARSGR